jgi:hypothetical protein
MGGVEVDSLSTQAMRTLIGGMRADCGEDRAVRRIRSSIIPGLLYGVIGSVARRRTDAGPECPEAQGRQHQDQKQSPGN